MDWDARYRGAASALFGDEPCEYVREIWARSDFSATDVVCLADGDGRNGRWLAAQGARVTAIDISAEATRIAVDKDRAARVNVDRQTADLAMWRPAADSGWDAAFQIYLQADEAARRAAAQTAAEHLRPGGWFVLEAFAKGAGGVGLGPTPDHLRYDVAELQSWLPDLGVVEALTGTTCLAEGEKHRGPAWVVRFAARKAG